MTRELFELNSQLKAEEDRVARLTAANKNKEDVIRQKEEEHRVELEKMGRSSRKTSKQHVSPHHYIIIVTFFAPSPRVVHVIRGKGIRLVFIKWGG